MRPPIPPPPQEQLLETWRSGHMTIELEGSPYKPVQASVELMRLGLLVMVIARADCDPKDNLGGFPIVASSVEWYPVQSLAPDRIAQMGAAMRDAFLDRIRQVVVGNIEAAVAAKAELAKLAEQSQSPAHLAELAGPSPSPPADPELP